MFPIKTFFGGLAAGSLFVLALTLYASNAHATPVDWAQPPAGCVEDQVASLAPPPCLDLSSLAEPTQDLPENLSESEKTFWTVDHPRDLAVCRSREVLRREAAKPGTYSVGKVMSHWMQANAVEHLPEKVDLIYEAAESVDMPPQILFGALKQESLLANIGITPDGNNYSCGIGQINVLEWCGAMNALPSAEQAAIGWPAGISCDEITLPTTLIAPFYKLAMKKLGAKPDYLLTPAEFAGIEQADVEGAFPSGGAALQKARFQAAASFVAHCTDFRLGIRAKAHELGRLFATAVPAALRDQERYSPGESYGRACRSPYRSSYYPFHTGWLMADAVYNAGARILGVVSHYFRMDRAAYESDAGWKDFTPIELIEALHGGGRYNPVTDKLDYVDAYGKAGSVTWFKMCVVQRHIARVVQYGTLAGQEVAKSLEVGGCSQSVFDAAGKLVTTKVPEYRRKSAGQR